MLIHRADLAPEKEFGSCWERVHIWRGKHCNSIWGKKAPNVAQEADGTLYVFDDFNSSDQVERARSKQRRKVRLVKIQDDMRNSGLKSVRIAIDGDHVTAHRAQSHGHAARPTPEVGSMHILTNVPAKDTFHNEFVKTVICQSSGNQFCCSAKTLR